MRVCWFAAALGLSVVSGRAWADERPTLSGTWNASVLTERWNIGDWGEACGPRPSPRGAPGGVVQVTESGGELVFSAGGYPRTSGCFEMGGGIVVTSHSASPRFWRTRCATPPNDPRKASIVTTVSATDTTISFDETGEYQFTFRAQNCTASVRRQRTYTLIKRLGEESPPVASTSAPAGAPTETAKATAPADSKTQAVCTTPGDPARIEVRPSRKVIRPGESFALIATVLDASGCRLAIVPTWSTSAGAGVTVSPAGVVMAAPDASEGETIVAATVHGRSAKVVVEVLSPERYAKLLETSGASRIENNEAAVAHVATVGIGAAAGEVSDGSRARRIAFGVILGVSTLALLVGGVVLLRRQKPETEVIEEWVDVEPKLVRVKKKRLIQKPVETVRCKICGKPYRRGTVYCADDGSRLD